MTLDLDAAVELGNRWHLYDGTYVNPFERHCEDCPGCTVLALADEVRRGNFFRDRLAERLSLAETAVVELECALSADPSYDPDHWRHYAESALDLCKRATLSRVPAEEAAE